MNRLFIPNVAHRIFLSVLAMSFIFLLAFMLSSCGDNIKLESALKSASAAGSSSAGSSSGDNNGNGSSSGSPYTNYVKYNGKYYRLNYGTVEAEHQNTGTGTGSNTKTFKLHGDKDAKGNVTLLMFIYFVHEWDGISKEWHDGIYQIKRGGGYYSYVCWFFADGREGYCPETGTLTIKTSGNIQTIRFVSDELTCYFCGEKV